MVHNTEYKASAAVDDHTINDVESSTRHHGQAVIECSSNMRCGDIHTFKTSTVRHRPSQALHTFPCLIERLNSLALVSFTSSVSKPRRIRCRIARDFTTALIIGDDYGDDRPLRQGLREPRKKWLRVILAGRNVSSLQEAVLL